MLLNVNNNFSYVNFKNRYQLTVYSTGKKTTYMHLRPCNWSEANTIRFETNYSFYDVTVTSLDF